MLNTLAVKFAQEFLNLPLTALTFFIERDFDFSIGRGQRLRCEAGIFTLDVKETDLFEVKQRLVIVRPIFHPARVNIVREVVDQLEARTLRLALNTRQIFKVDIVDREPFAALIGIAIDQIENRAANPADGGDAQLHRPRLIGNRLRACCDQMVVSFHCILDAECHATCARPMFAREIPSGGARFIIGDQIDPALTPQVDMLAAMGCDMGEAHRLKHRLKLAFFRRAKFHKFKAIEASRIFKQISHLLRILGLLI